MVLIDLTPGILLNSSTRNSCRAQNSGNLTLRIISYSPVTMKEGKGRPIHGYKLSKGFNEILEEIIMDLSSEIQEIEDKIKKLQEFKH